MPRIAGSCISYHLVLVFFLCKSLLELQFSTRTEPKPPKGPEPCGKNRASASRFKASLPSRRNIKASVGANSRTIAVTPLGNEPSPRGPMPDITAMAAAMEYGVLLHQNEIQNHNINKT